jgi:hypothetical protein
MPFHMLNTLLYCNDNIDDLTNTVTSPSNVLLPIVALKEYNLPLYILLISIILFAYRSFQCIPSGSELSNRTTKLFFVTKSNDL